MGQYSDFLDIIVSILKKLVTYRQLQYRKFLYIQQMYTPNI